MGPRWPPERWWGASDCTRRRGCPDRTAACAAAHARARSPIGAHARRVRTFKRVCICMSRYMTAMANLIFPKMAVAAIGPGPGWRGPPKTRSESLGTFRSYLTLLHFSETLDRENHALRDASPPARKFELLRLANSPAALRKRPTNIIADQWRNVEAANSKSRALVSLATSLDHVITLPRS